jgi:hypothetical protein
MAPHADSGNNPAHEIPDGWSLMQWINGEMQQQFPAGIRMAEGTHKNAWRQLDSIESSGSGRRRYENDSGFMD